MKKKNIGLIGVLLFACLIFYNNTFILTVLLAGYLYCMLKRQTKILVDYSIFVLLFVSLHLIISVLGSLLIGTPPGDSELLLFYNVGISIILLLLSVHYHFGKN